jgi:hypothetical protein
VLATTIIIIKIKKDFSKSNVVEPKLAHPLVVEDLT